MAVSMAPGAMAYSTALDEDPSFYPFVQTSEVFRVAGSDRIATAVKASQVRYPGDKFKTTAESVILVRDDDFADALVSGPLADVTNSPILVNPQAYLDWRVEQEIKRLAHQAAQEGHDFKVIIVGGPGAISEKVEKTILYDLDFDTDRLQGSDRYDTAVAVSTLTIEEYAYDVNLDQINVFITTGKDFPDALAAGTAAASDNGIVLLSAGDEAADATDDFVNDELDTFIQNHEYNAPEIVAVGGPADKAYPDADFSYVGVNRYHTAAVLAEEYFEFDISKPGKFNNNVGVASGLTYADAVVAAGFMANSDGPLLLTRPGKLDAYTARYLVSQADQIDNAFVFGGKSTLSVAVAVEVADALFL